MRVRNLLTIFVCLVSPSVLLTTAGMDVRSYRALDDCYNRYGSVFCDVNSFNGRCVIRLNERVQLRTDINPRTDPLASAHPYALLQRYDPTAPGNLPAWAH